MDKLEARVRIFECLYNTQFGQLMRITNQQLDELVNKTIEIEQKLNKGEKDYEHF